MRFLQQQQVRTFFCSEFVRQHPSKGVDVSRKRVGRVVPLKREGVHLKSSPSAYQDNFLMKWNYNNIENKQEGGYWRILL